MKTKAFGGATIQGAWPLLEESFWADPGKSIFSILDGMGGVGIGDLMLESALGILKEELSVISNNLAGTATLGFSPREKIFSAIMQKMHDSLLAKNSTLPFSKRGALSIAIASISKPNTLSVLNLGACSISLFRQNNFYLVSPPQLWELPEEGLLLPRQALGLDNVLLPELRSFSVQSGDILVLHSSGFSLQFPGVSDFLRNEFSRRSAGESLQAIADAVLAEFAATSAFYNQSLLLVEI